MPPTRVIFYQDDNGDVPVWAWLQALFQQNAKAYAKCRAYLNLLAEYGHELRRPHAENLGGGIYELRPRLGHVNYRILYFFHGQNIDLTNVPAGTYDLMHRVNAEMRLHELRYDNDAASVRIRLMWRNGTPSVRVLRTSQASAGC